MTIPSGLRRPGVYTELDDSGMNVPLPVDLQELLIIAPRTSAGTVAKEIPTRVYSGDEAATYFGAGSIAHRMAIAALAQFRNVILTICALDDSGTGVPATATIAITGPATADGTMRTWIGNDYIDIAITDEDTATEIGELLEAAINARTELPVTANNVTGTVTLTAKNDGTTGNMIGRYDATATKFEPETEIDCSGVSTVVTGFSAGANDPALTGAFAAVLPHRYHLIAFPYTDTTNITAIADHLDSVSDETNQRGARAYAFMAGALADATTRAGENNKRLHIGYIRKVRKPAFELAAAFAAMQASESNLALPLNNKELKGCDAPAIADRFVDPSELETLLAAGVTPFVVGSGEKVRCVRAITTYHLTAGGSPTARWLDSTKVGIADYVRQAIIDSHTQRFATCVIKDVHSDNDADYIVTTGDIKSSNIDVMRRIERDKGYVDNVETYIDQFECERDSEDDTRVNSIIPMDPVDPLHILATTIKVVS